MQTFDLTPFVEFSTFFKTHQYLLSPPQNEHIFCLAFCLLQPFPISVRQDKRKSKSEARCQKLAVKKVSFFRHPLVTDEL